LARGKYSLRGTQVYAPRYRSEWLSKIISASIGVATYPGESADAESLIKNADVTMYQAKEQGCNRYRFQTVTVN
jgi:diguanylate cyclase (GGDEF)-like protein